MKIHLESLPQAEQHDVEMISRLLGLPGKILTNHETEGLAHIVLHDLAHTNSFGLERAGYFIDNPDFNCLRGVAGFCNTECHFHQNDIWHDPGSFMANMQNAEFHRKLSTYLDHSLIRNDKADVNDDSISALGEQLGISKPLSLCWKMKHGNNGILIFSAQGEHSARYYELLREIIPLLGLC